MKSCLGIISTMVSVRPSPARKIRHCGSRHLQKEEGLRAPAPRKVTIAECTSMVEARTDECCARDAVSAYIALIHKVRRSSLCHMQRHITRAVHRICLRSKKKKIEEEGLERKYNDILPASEQGKKEYLLSNQLRT